MKKSRKLLGIFSVVLATTTLFGCSKSVSSSAADKARKNADMVIDDDLHIVVTYSEDFDKSYYDENELESKVNSEIEDFNKEEASSNIKTSNSDESDVTPLSLDSLQVKNEKAKLKLKFATYTNYVNYCNNYINNNEDNENSEESTESEDSEESTESEDSEDSTDNKDGEVRTELFVGKLKECELAGHSISQKLKQVDEDKIIKKTDIEDKDELYCLYSNEEMKIAITGKVLYYSENVEFKDGVATTCDKEENYVIFKLNSGKKK